MLFEKQLKRNSQTKPKDLRVVNKKTSFWKPFLLMLPAFSIIILFTIIPFVYSTIDGFSKPNGPGQITPADSWTIDSFKSVIKDKAFTKGLSNSLLYAIMVVPLTISISALISSAISSVIRKKIRGIIQTIFFLPYITSAIAISLAFTYLMNYDTGLLNKFIKLLTGHKVQFFSGTPNTKGALWAMLIYGTWRGLAFNILIFTTAMLGVDKTQYKAASIDGAGPVKQFFKITLPSINRTTNFLITMGIIGSIKVFPLALFNNNAGEAIARGGSTLLLYIYQMIRVNAFKAGAASVLLVAISIGFSFAVKQSFNIIIKTFTKIGEIRVINKIKNKTFISKL